MDPDYTGLVLIIRLALFFETSLRNLHKIMFFKSKLTNSIIVRDSCFSKTPKTGKL